MKSQKKNMYKLLFLGLVLLLSPSLSVAQLRLSENTVEMRQLIIDHFDFKDFEFRPLKNLYPNIPDSIQNKDVDFLKLADLDHDGLDELLVMGIGSDRERSDGELSVFIIKQKRKGFEKFDLSSYFFLSYLGPSFILPKVITIENSDYIQFDYLFKNRECNDSDFFISRTITLFLSKEGISPKQTPSLINFKSLKISSSYCLGTCPVFEFFISNTGDARFKGIDYTKRKGDIPLRADQSEIDQINRIIGSMNFNKKKENYSICWTDQSTKEVEIILEDGKKYRIEDYGEVGSYELTMLYDYINEILKVYL